MAHTHLINIEMGSTGQHVPLQIPSIGFCGFGFLQWPVARDIDPMESSLAADAPRAADQAQGFALELEVGHLVSRTK